MHRYIPHTPADRAAMLARCGMQSEAELYADVPRELLLGRHYAIGERDEREKRSATSSARSTISTGPQPYALPATDSTTTWLPQP